jgi:magnesium-transporting ATPase (P-type)
MYWIKVLTRWIEHSYLLFAAFLIANYLLFGAVSSEDKDMISAVSSLDSTNRHTIFILLGPLINLYLWFQLSHLFSESEDDVFIKNKIHPSLIQRKTIITLFPVTTGIFLFPLTLWFYTKECAKLWGQDLLSITNPGILLGLFFLGIAMAVLPKLFPSYRRNIRMEVSDELRKKYT